jgi:hypothetical protein
MQGCNPRAVLEAETDWQAGGLNDSLASAEPLETKNRLSFWVRR